MQQVVKKAKHLVTPIEVFLLHPNRIQLIEVAHILGFSGENATYLRTVDGEKWRRGYIQYQWIFLKTEHNEQVFKEIQQAIGVKTIGEYNEIFAKLIPPTNEEWRELVRTSS